MSIFFGILLGIVYLQLDNSFPAGLQNRWEILIAKLLLFFGVFKIGAVDYLLINSVNTEECK